jgi:hypothetical protein
LDELKAVTASALAVVARLQSMRRPIGIDVTLTVIRRAAA